MFRKPPRQRQRLGSSCCLSSLGDNSRVLRDVLCGNYSHTTPYKTVLVVAVRNKQIKTSRATYGDLCVRQRPGYDDRIGKQQASCGFEKSAPLSDDA